MRRLLGLPSFNQIIFLFLLQFNYVLGGITYYTHTLWIFHQLICTLMVIIVINYHHHPGTVKKKASQ